MDDGRVWSGWAEPMREVESDAAYRDRSLVLAARCSFGFVRWGSSSRHVGADRRLAIALQDRVIDG